MSIEPEAYIRQDIFDAEIERLFGARMHVGSMHDLSQIDNYFTLTVGNTAITVRRTADGVRAFDNVCLHRCALIDPTGAGKRQFRCRYHAWGYAADGKLHTTPLIENANLRKRQLQQYPLTEIGDQVFVGLAGKIPDTDKVAYALNQIGIPKDTPAPFHREEIVRNCNWKVIVENNIETYHLSFVHPKSFIPAGFVSKSDYIWGSDAYTSWARCTPADETSKLKMFERIMPHTKHEFCHAFIFPNLFVTATNRLVGFRSSTIPLDPIHTLLRWELFELPAMQALAEPIREQIRVSAIDFTVTSLLEDEPLVEACQHGLASRNATIQLQSPDAHIQRFHDYYIEQMNHAAG